MFRHRCFLHLIVFFTLILPFSSASADLATEGPAVNVEYVVEYLKREFLYDFALQSNPIKYSTGTYNSIKNQSVNVEYAAKIVDLFNHDYCGFPAQFSSVTNKQIINDVFAKEFFHKHICFEDCALSYSPALSPNDYDLPAPVILQLATGNNSSNRMGLLGYLVQGNMVFPWTTNGMAPAYKYVALSEVVGYIQNGTPINVSVPANSGQSFDNIFGTGTVVSWCSSCGFDIAEGNGILIGVHKRYGRLFAASGGTLAGTVGEVGTPVSGGMSMSGGAQRAYNIAFLNGWFIVVRNRDGDTTKVLISQNGTDWYQRDVGTAAGKNYQMKVIPGLNEVRFYTEDLSGDIIVATLSSIGEFGNIKRYPKITTITSDLVNTVEKINGLWYMLTTKGYLGKSISGKCFRMVAPIFPVPPAIGGVTGATGYHFGLTQNSTAAFVQYCPDAGSGGCRENSGTYRHYISFDQDTWYRVRPQPLLIGDAAYRFPVAQSSNQAWHGGGVLFDYNGNTILVVSSSQDYDARFAIYYGLLPPP